MREESAVAGNNITDECNSTDGEVSKSDDGVDLRPDDDEDSKHDDDEESNFDEGEDPKSDDDEDSRPNDDQNQSLVVDSSIVSDTVRLDVPSPILTDRTKLVSRDVTQQTDLDHLNSVKEKISQFVSSICKAGASTVVMVKTVVMPMYLFVNFLSDLEN